MYSTYIQYIVRHLINQIIRYIIQDRTERKAERKAEKKDRTDLALGAAIPPNSACICTVQL